MCNKPRVLFAKTACIVLILWDVHARADEIPAMPSAPDSLLVGEMLRLDAQRAHAAERAKAAIMPGAAMSVPGAGSLVVPSLLQTNPEPAVPPASLSAIYGVGKQLYADVYIHGQAFTYAAGHAQPIRASQPNTPYRLRAIRPPCVRLDTRSAGAKLAASALELCLGGKP